MNAERDAAKRPPKPDRKIPANEEWDVPLVVDPYYESDAVILHHGDALEVARTLPDGLARTIVTSPPYFGLRDYGESGQIGAEPSVGEYVTRMVELFREMRRVLSDDGTLWLNIGDSYGSTPGWGRGGGSTLDGAKNSTPGRSGQRVRPRSNMSPKNLIGVPWRVALALQDDGWILRSDIIWHKPNPMPESVMDRPTKSHEYLFLFSKSPSYYYDAESIAEEQSTKEVGRFLGTRGAHGYNAASGAQRDKSGSYGDGQTRNKRTVWTVPTVPFAGSHFAVYPPDLIRPCIRAGSEPGDIVLDPFSGSGTTGAVANFEGRRYVGIDLNKDYLDLSLRTRFQQPALPWGA